MVVYQRISGDILPEVGMLIGFGHDRFYNQLYINVLENKPCPRLAVSDKAPAVTNHYQPLPTTNVAITNHFVNYTGFAAKDAFVR